MKKRAIREYIIILAITLTVCAFTIIFSMLEYVFTENTAKIAATAEKNTNVVIIIDAGHGGEDSGAVGYDGTLEKDINLDIANKLFDLLRISDIEAIMTRHDDSMLYSGKPARKKQSDLKNRVAFTQEYPDSLFVSIHQNKFPIEKYKGLQVYYSPNHTGSKIMAAHIQKYIKQHLQPDNNREIKPSGSNIYVLHHTKVPAVLVECGFLSNTEDTQNLNSEEYRKKIAFLLFKAICQYYSDSENGEIN